MAIKVMPNIEIICGVLGVVNDQAKELVKKGYLPVGGPAVSNGFVYITMIKMNKLDI